MRTPAKAFEKAPAPSGRAFAAPGAPFRTEGRSL